MTTTVKDQMIEYYESPEFVTYLEAYNAALEAEAERILTFQKFGVDRYSYTDIPECNEAQRVYLAACDESARLLEICRATPIHLKTFGW